MFYDYFCLLLVFTHLNTKCVKTRSKQKECLPFNFSVPKTVSKTTNFAISNRGPTLWNKLLSTTEKQIDSPSLFKATIKKLLLNSTNELVYF